MQSVSDRPVRTFTIGFEEEFYNEAPAARQIASHLGTEHTELYVTPEQTLAVIPRMPEIFDEPFSDSSQVPTFLVSELTRRHVTVSLSGDGGDELFAGYTRYAVGRELWGATGWIPRFLRRVGARTLRALPKRPLDVGLGWLVPVLNRYRTAGTAGDKVYKVAEILGHGTAEDLYVDLLSHWKRPEEVVRGSREPPTRHLDVRDIPNLPELTHRMMLIDLANYLPDDILVKVDRASMAVGLEARVPILDHRVVELAWRLPLSMKLRDGKGKWILRRVLHKYVPEELMARPKTGFGVPIDRWLRGPLREWAEALLDEDRIRREGWFDPGPIRTKWSEHLSGQRNWHYYLWDVLMFQAWLDAQASSGVTATCAG
jgi:asparagine synthase (glutamine-hydrolysing)